MIVIVRVIVIVTIRALKKVINPGKPQNPECRLLCQAAWASEHSPPGAKSSSSPEGSGHEDMVFLCFFPCDTVFVLYFRGFALSQGSGFRSLLL